MNSNMGRTVIVSAAGSAIVLIVCLTLLIETNKDPGPLIAFVSSYLSLAVPMFINSRISVKTSQTLDEVKGTVDKVNTNVNGHLSVLSERAGLIEKQAHDSTEPDTGP